ncbi:MAG: hypothetical protein SFT93_04535 [Rickettsiaceae bacterium]|nr:hypothetical protein [Rickettsiaceae bacterium]
MKKMLEVKRYFLNRLYVSREEIYELICLVIDFKKQGGYLPPKDLVLKELREDIKKAELLERRLVIEHDSRAGYRRLIEFSATKNDPNILKAFIDNTNSSLNELLDEPWALRTNKLKYLLLGAQKIVQSEYDDIMNYLDKQKEEIFCTCFNSGMTIEFADVLETSRKDIMYGALNWDTTAYADYLQTMLLEILSITSNCRVADVGLLAAKKIYNLDESPNIQGIRSLHNVFDILPEYRWFAKKHKLNSWDRECYTELVVPSLGYYYGGTRVPEWNEHLEIKDVIDKAYQHKTFKMEDCSSFVGKFIDADPNIDTSDMLLGKIVQMHKYEESHKPKSGDIFVYKGHCGFVIEFDESNKTLITLECHRHMPFRDGFLLKKYHVEDNGYITASFEEFCGTEVEMFCGLDLSLPEGNSETYGPVSYYHCFATDNDDSS